MNLIKEIIINRKEYHNNLLYPATYSGTLYVRDIFTELSEDLSRMIANYPDTYILLLNYSDCLINTIETEEKNHFSVKIYEV